MAWFFVMLMLVVIVAYVYRWFAEAGQRRAAYLRLYHLPASTLDRFQHVYPDLTPAQVTQVEQGLQRFFVYYQKSGYQPIVPPSRVVAELWQAFTQDQRPYAQFCRRAFGHVLPPHHAIAFGTDPEQNRGLSLIWMLSCRYELINPRTPATLPMLFALDATLGIADGLLYRLDSTGLYSAGLRIGADPAPMNGEKNEILCHSIATLEADYDLNNYFDPQ